MQANGFVIGRVIATWAVLFVLAGRVSVFAADSDEVKLNIVVSIFPQYDFTRRIAGDRAKVVLLLPPGAESHTYEPSPSDMTTIARSDIFIYTGAEMEPWAKRFADSTAAEHTLIVDASRNVPLLRNGNIDAKEKRGNHAHDEGHLHIYDPHVWLDPLLAVAMTENIAAALSKRDPAGADVYAANAAGLVADLKQMDKEFREIIAALPRRTLVFGDRFAFRYFFLRYGLEEVGPYKDCAPGAEPGPMAVIAVEKYIRENQVRFAYRETAETDRLSRVLAEETGVEILPVDSLHTLSPGLFAAGATYLGVMRENMAAFAKGLQ